MNNISKHVISSAGAGLGSGLAHEVAGLSFSQAAGFGASAAFFYSIQRTITEKMSEIKTVKTFIHQLPPKFSLFSDTLLKAAQMGLSLLAAYRLEVQLGVALSIEGVIILGVVVTVSITLVNQLFARVHPVKKEPTKDIESQSSKKEEKKLQTTKSTEKSAETPKTTPKPIPSFPLTIVENLKDYTISPAALVKKLQDPSFEKEIKKQISHINKLTRLSEEKFVEVFSESLSNKSLNRYVDVLPFNHNRITIGDTHSFFNGSHVKLEDRKYIFTQGPLPHTVEDFWKVLWEQDSSLVLTFTDEIEDDRKKTEAWWNWDNWKTIPYEFKGYKIEKLQEETIAERKHKSAGRDESAQAVIQSKFQVSHAGKTKEVLHLHFSGWKDHHVPHLDLFAEFLEKVDEIEKQGPVTAHCSAGVGRTGVFAICYELFIQIKQLPENEKSRFVVNIPQLIVDLRQHRSGMVQTESQLHFIYRFVAAAAGFEVEES